MYRQPRMDKLYREFGACSPGKKKMKIGLSETTYAAFPGSNAINHSTQGMNYSYIFFVELSVLSLVIHNCHALISKPFQSQANCKLLHVKSLLISSQSECFCMVIIFQAVLNISATQNPLVRTNHPKAPRKF